MYNRIVVPLGGSRFAEEAIPLALTILSRTGGVLSLATVAALGSGYSVREMGSARDEGVEQAERYMKAVEERIRAAGFKGEVEWSVIPPGNIAASVVRHAREVAADLVVMTTHGRGPMRRAWLGSVADGVIRTSPIPVLLVRPPFDDPEARSGEGGTEISFTPADWSEALSGPLFQNVLTTLDGSLRSEVILPLIPPLLEPGAAVTLLQTVPPAAPGGYPYLPHSIQEEREQKEVRKETQRYLDDRGGELRAKGHQVEAVVKTSQHPGAAILKHAAQSGCDLIAMSTAGRGGVARLLLGSTADKVIRGSGVPVLVHRDRPGEE